ncbi:hypothetical protein AZ34_16340 [Hylemonella gracilis str. Niagara R]|uniref:DUF4198 domain-containing protein n=1 Tax=Hylemonella gracilis str. Niagara R TaxID=1458275 RepID=A0A016XKW2_9BURK|nr:DUF4198 domain-containing protein [Hylemonella gracilis]EYC52471.1 hypothetical protein AZ34_16340 [Hylemonella gracilis str. Niagara R]
MNQNHLLHAYSKRATRALTCACLMLAGAAQAHTPYLLPMSFDVAPDAVLSVDAGYAEKFFLSEVGFGDTRFTLTTPDGSVLPFGEVHQLKSRTVAEQKLPGAKGTYRLSTGVRLGSIFRSWEQDGKVEISRDGNKTPPPGVKLLSHYQSHSVSEAYVTAGAPNKRALEPAQQGLEIVPITHPNDLFTGEKFEFTVLFDGKPLSGQTVDIYRSPMDLGSEHTSDSAKTDAQGRIAYAMTEPGVYLALVRYRGAAPKGAAAPMYGYNYTLTFRVLKP